MSPGRPKLPAAQKRTIRKGIAFSPEEYDRLCTIAFRLGMGVNEFIRLMVVGESPQKEPHREASCTLHRIELD